MTTIVSAAAPSDNVSMITLNSPSESSSGWGSNPTRAIDGRRNSNWADSSCTHTELSTTPWWKANLARRSTVHSVRMWNRMDCCTERLFGVQVHECYADKVNRFHMNNHCVLTLLNNVKTLRHVEHMKNNINQHTIFLRCTSTTSSAGTMLSSVQTTPLQP
jgi:hypothetical protein